MCCGLPWHLPLHWPECHDYRRHGHLIVIESARSLDVKISFMAFLKPGLVVTVITLLLSMGILYLQMAG